ncbi:MAG: SAF domain-containing protein [Pseudoclavibacter sp.]|nr:SAF domain-containing protein [Pseudoclavibacter sp.]
MLVALGLALVLLSGLASYAVLTSAGGTRHVLVATTHIAFGQRIAAADLGTIAIAGGQPHAGVPAERLEEIAGQVAVVPLPAGSMLTEEAVAPEPLVRPGTAIVGIPLASEQLPSHPLAPGSTARIVLTPGADGVVPEPDEIPTVEAEVRAVRSDERTGVTVVDVQVPAGLGPQLASWAATGRVALVLDAADG